MLIAETYGKSYPQEEPTVCITKKPLENPYKQRLSSGSRTVENDREK